MQASGELKLLRATLNKYRLHSFVVSPKSPGFFKDKMHIFGNFKSHDKLSFEEHFGKVENKTIYRHLDNFGCRYIYFCLPDDEEKVLLIGPYLTEEISPESVFETAEKHLLPASSVPSVESYLKSVPVIFESHYIFGMIEAFCEDKWGDSFSVFDRQAEDTYSLPQHSDEGNYMEFELIEKRYEFENDLMDSVSKGQFHKAELILSSFNSSSFERRLSDPVRNLKNYCIIMNTLLRKAAEKGGVRPFYLDRQSGSFAMKIENTQTVDGIRNLMSEMFRSYCLLVKKHATSKYSSPIQKAITVIDSDLSATLNLATLARLQGISPSYLSSAFKKETGQTITEHINQKRMELAKHLLSTTRLQVQTISQHCGILDVQYFSKLFKKYTGKTPLDYRKS